MKSSYKVGLALYENWKSKPSAALYPTQKLLNFDAGLKAIQAKVSDLIGQLRCGVRIAQPSLLSELQSIEKQSAYKETLRNNIKALEDLVEQIRAFLGEKTFSEIWNRDFSTDVLDNDYINKFFNRLGLFKEAMNNKCAEIYKKLPNQNECFLQFIYTYGKDKSVFVCQNDANKFWKDLCETDPANAQAILDLYNSLSPYNDRSGYIDTFSLDECFEKIYQALESLSTSQLHTNELSKQIFIWIGDLSILPRSEQPSAEEALKLSEFVLEMTKDLIDDSKDPQSKLGAIDTFEKNVCSMPYFKKESRNQNIKIMDILIIATSFVIGAVLGIPLITGLATCAALGTLVTDFAPEPKGETTGLGSVTSFFSGRKLSSLFFIDQVSCIVAQARKSVLQEQAHESNNITPSDNVLVI